MKIWVDISYELKNKTGIGAYMLTLLKCLKTIDNIEVETFNCNWDKKGIRAFLHMIWLNTLFLFKAFIQKPDVILFPNFRMPFFKIKNVQYIVTLHDFAMFKKGYLTKQAAWTFSMAVKNAIKKADKIIVVSEEIKKELYERFPECKQSVYIMYNSVRSNIDDVDDKIFDELSIEKKSYIFTIGSNYKGKNIVELVKAFNLLSDEYPKLKLVISGKKGNSEYDDLIGSNPKIIRTGYISDEKVSSLYKNAILHVFPSIYEGFGIPLIEAQYCKCPELCSNIPVFKEIAKESAEFCEPEYNDIAIKIKYLISTPQRQDELILLGSKNIERFSIENITKQVREIIYDAK